MTRVPFFITFLSRIVVLSIPLMSVLAAQSAGSGAIEGRVFNAATSSALRNARVSIDGSDVSTTTDDAGNYRLSGIAPGAVRVSVFHVGMERQSLSVDVRAGEVARREFELTTSGGATASDVVRLEKFSVIESSEMSAQAIAINEQRASATIKSVVAFDEFGDRGYENVGEFLHFLPGVAVNVDGDSGPDGVSIRGFPGSGASITLDGGNLAGARGNSRRLDMSEVPLANVSRIEVTKVPTPDVPAEGLGGTINLITRGGFEKKTPSFSYHTSATLHSTNELALDWPKHHIPKNSPGFTRPSVDFTYFHPVNDSLAITIGAAYSWRLKAMDDSDDSRDETPNWDQVRGIQRTSDWASRVQQYTTISGQVGLDWRIGPKHTFGADVYHKDYSMVVTRNNLAVDFGVGATGDARFSQGAATGVGQVNQQTGTWYEHDSQTSQLNFKYAYKSEGWRFDAIGSWSRSDYHLRDVENGHFRTAPSRIMDLIIRGDDIAPKGIPRRFSATTRTGSAVDIYNGELYSIISGTSTPQENFTINKSGRLDLARDFGGAINLTVKTGLAVDQRERDLRTQSKTWNFRPNGATDVTARLAGRFDVFDDSFLAGAEGIYGVPFRACSLRKVYQLYQQNPNWFVLDEPAAYQSSVTGSREFEETISAAYVRTDVRLLQKRLWLAGGVRFEQTEVEGRGPLDDINAQYQRDARGNFIRNAAGQRVLITSDALALRKLRYVERGATGGNEYDGFYPSLNATYTLSDHLLVRAAYARTIGRPDTNFIIPGTTISDPDVASPTITVSNTGLVPWTADGYDLSLELYDFKGGSGSVGIFHKSVSDFFGSVRSAVTPALLDEYGLEDDGSFANYEIATRHNAGDAQITGYEFSYRQSLTFLPQWARGLQVFVNATKMELNGSATADFGDFNPLKYSGGINFIRPRYAVKLTYSHQDETRREAVAVSAANGIPAGTYNYREAYSRWGVHAQYALGKRFSLYGSLKDLGGLTIRELRYAPDTPEFARGRRLQQLGYYLTVGVKGTF